MLEGTGLFEVDIAESPAPGAKMGGFEPKFASYKLVVLNYNGEMWPPSTRRAFSAYVKNGGGVVAYHAAAIAFAGWPEYNEIIGLGGWSNRNESFGPYVYWKDGAVALDPGPGIAGYHPQPFVYPVVHRDTTHPITAGLPEKWMHAEDELYSLLRGPAKNLTVLATARSGFENGGTGRDEPVLFTVSYGAGRIFHTVLGHAADANPPGLECAGFITTFQRGAEWAATGKVTQQAPPDFPVTTRDVGTPEDVRLWPGFQPPTLEAILKDLATIEYSRDEAVLYRLREYVLAHNKSEASRAACEQELLAGLGAATQSYAVLALCRALRLVGSEDSVPALEKLLANEETTDAARYALEKIPGAAAEAALLRSLGATQGQIRIGIVSSLGQRRSPEAVDPLAALIFDPDAEIARAAVISLGRIGGAAASAALAEAYGKAEGALKTELAYALLGSIDLQIADRDFPAALALADKLLAAPPEALPAALRQAAFKAKLLSLEKPEAARLVLETLARGPEEMRQPALGQVTKLYSEAEIGSLASLLPKLPEPSQVQLIAVLAGYPKAAALAPVAAALKAESMPVRLAALKALASFGDVPTALLLARHAASAKGDEQAAAREALGRMPGKDIDEAILFQLLASPDDALKSEFIRAVGARRIPAGKGLLVAAARSGTPANSAQAARALRSVAEPADIPDLLDVLLATGDEAVQDEMRTTIGIVAQRTLDSGLRAGAVRRLLVPPTGSDVGPRARPQEARSPLPDARQYRRQRRAAGPSRGARRRKRRDQGRRRPGAFRLAERGGPGGLPAHRPDHRQLEPPGSLSPRLRTDGRIGQIPVAADGRALPEDGVRPGHPAGGEDPHSRRPPGVPVTRCPRVRRVARRDRRHPGRGPGRRGCHQGKTRTIIMEDQAPPSAPPPEHRRIGAPELMHRIRSLVPQAMLRDRAFAAHRLRELGDRFGPAGRPKGYKGDRKSMLSPDSPKTQSLIEQLAAIEERLRQSAAEHDARRRNRPHVRVPRALPIAAKAQEIVQAIRPAARRHHFRRDGLRQKHPDPQDVPGGRPGGGREDRLHPAPPDRRRHHRPSHRRGDGRAPRPVGRLQDPFPGQDAARGLHQDHDRRHAPGRDAVRPTAPANTTRSSSTKPTSGA